MTEPNTFSRIKNFFGLLAFFELIAPTKLLNCKEYSPKGIFP
jgi:hypothetical protein